MFPGMAERVGFEPTDGYPSAVFKTAAINRSTTSPDGDAAQVGHRQPFIKQKLEGNESFPDNPLAFLMSLPYFRHASPHG